MFFKIVIHLIDNKDTYEADIVKEKGIPFLDVSFNEITINTNTTTRLSQILSHDAFNSLLKKEQKNLDNLISVSDYSNIIEGKKLIDYLLDNDINVFNSVEDIWFDFDHRAEKYILRNPILNLKRLCCKGRFGINRKDYNSTEKVFGNVDMYYLLEGNEALVNKQIYLNTVMAIENIVKKIKKYNLSPLEQIMYAYDLVRDRLYVKEDNDEDYMLSRDITPVLLGDKIVCCGFANIFEKVLSNLDISSSFNAIVKKDNKGHVRNMVFIKDSKYHVRGLYYFDTTWDCKKNITDNNFLTSYKYFAKNKEEMDEVNYRHQYIDMDIPHYNKDLTQKIIDIIDTEGFMEIPLTLIEEVNFIARMIDHKSLLNESLYTTSDINIVNFMKKFISEDDIKKRLLKYQKLLFAPKIDIKKMIDLIYNVRKIEYYDNPNKYQLSYEIMQRIITNSKLTPPKSREELLLDAIFGISSCNETAISYLEKKYPEEKIEYDTEGLNLTRTLKKVVDKKQN